jgi:hypothetical protein
MRFSVFTLLIVLPAAAYAAVCPQQFSIEPGCRELYAICDIFHPCCDDLECMWFDLRRVCAIAYYHDSLSLMMNKEMYTYWRLNQQAVCGNFQELAVIYLRRGALVDGMAGVPLLRCA